MKPYVLGGLRDKLDVPERVRKKAKGNLSFIGGLPQPIKGRTGASFIVPVKRERRVIFRKWNVEGGQ